MFERFTERARQAVVMAQEEARTLKHNYIGTEHILLGLLREEEGVAARVLESLDITLERVRAQVVRIVGSGEEVTSGQIPFTPRAKKVLELALREALSIGHKYIGTEHILLGLLRENEGVVRGNEGVAARILLDLDADSEKIRDEVIRMLSGAGGPTASAGMTASAGITEPRLGIDPAWINGLDRVLGPLAAEIRRELGREPDGGDLLLALASSRHTTAARALRELGVELDALWGTVERVRHDDIRKREQLEQRIQETRRAKQQALEEKDFAQAARLRDQERELNEQTGSDRGAESELLDAIRQRLGIPRPPAI